MGEVENSQRTPGSGLACSHTHILLEKASNVFKLNMNGWVSLFVPSRLRKGSEYLLDDNAIYQEILFYFIFYKDFIYLFMTEKERERERDRQREKQVPCREPNGGLDPRSPGPHPGPKAAL